MLSKIRLKCSIKVSILAIDKILKMVIMSKYNTDESQNTLFRLMLFLCKSLFFTKLYCPKDDLELEALIEHWHKLMSASPSRGD